MPFPTDSARAPRTSHARFVAAVLIVLTLIALAVAWSVTPLAGMLDPRRLAAYEQQARGWLLAPLVVVALHVASGLVAAPATLMIGATVLLFGAWPGVLYAFAGMMTNGAVVYAIGRYAARDMVDDWLARKAGSRLEAFNRTLVRRGFVAVALMRLTPIPFTLQNLMAGASRIGFLDFVLGTAIGILPVIALMAGVATEFDAWLEHPDWGRLLALIGAVLAAAAIAWSLKRWAVRHDIGR